MALVEANPSDLLSDRALKFVSFVSFFLSLVETNSWAPWTKHRSTWSSVRSIARRPCTKATPSSSNRSLTTKSFDFTVERTLGLTFAVAIPSIGRLSHVPSGLRRGRPLHGDHARPPWHRVARLHPQTRPPLPVSPSSIFFPF